MEETIVKKEFWSNGNLCIETPLNNNGQKHGLVRCWNKKGNIESEALYKNGEAQLIMEWYFNGDKWCEITYKNNQRHGLSIWFIYK